MAHLSFPSFHGAWKHWQDCRAPFGIRPSVTGSPPASVAAPDLETPTQLKRAQRDGMFPSIAVGRERPNSISLGPEILGFELSDAISTHDFAVSREMGPTHSILCCQLPYLVTHREAISIMLFIMPPGGIWHTVHIKI